MNVDLDVAPEGAEAVHAGGEGLYAAWYRKDVSGLVEQICPGAGINTWTWMGGRKDFPVGSVIRPPILLGHAPYASQWNGEGLPPVGADIEWMGIHGGYWVPAKVIAATDAEIVVQHAPGQKYKPGKYDVWTTDGRTKFRQSPPTHLFSQRIYAVQISVARVIT